MAVPINVCAANQKIKVNPVYQNSKVIKGKTKKRYRVQAKIGKKKYQTKADCKGNFRLRIPKQSVGKSFYIKVYRGKRYILKKKIHVLTKSIKVQKFSIKNKIIKGYARPGYRIKITMNHKSYQTKASRVKGSFKIQMKRPAGNATAKISLYNKKGKYIKSAKYSAYNKKSNKKDQNTKKAQYTTADGKKYTGKVPEFDDPINLSAVEKQMNEAGMEYDDSKTIIETSSGRAFMNATSGHGQGYYGWIVTIWKQKVIISGNGIMQRMELHCIISQQQQEIYAIPQHQIVMIQQPMKEKLNPDRQANFHQPIKVPEICHT